MNVLSRQLNLKRRRSGWTLLELLLAMIIIGVLFGSVVMSGRAIRNARRGSAARQQLALIAGAIEQYAGFWPQWKAGSVVVADKGWPDFIAGRVFGACPTGLGPYESIGGFNDSVTLAGPGWINDPVAILNANTCLSFQLVASSGKGPYVHDREAAILKGGADFVSGSTRILYPGFDTACVAGGGRAKVAEIFVDPWDTPLRYFWVYRDASNTSYRGFLPVDFGPIVNDNGAFGAQNPDFQQVASSALQVAAGFVLESAGPDKKFGNVWKVNPTATEIADAKDNGVISP